MGRFRTMPLLQNWTQLEKVLRSVDANINTYSTRVVSGSGDLTPEDDTILVDTSGGSVTLALPPAADMRDRCLTVKKMDAANTVTLTPDGSETIDGAATLAWATQYAAYTLQAVTLPSGATGWVIV